MLEATGLRAGYGRGPDVLLDAAVSVGDGEMVALIGLNGAGKSTTVRTIAGLLPARAGSVTFDGEDITNLSTDARARRGIVLVPEGRELCPTMTVEENLLLGTVPVARADRRRVTAENSELVYGLFPILLDKRKDPAGSLSGGQQQMVAVGRALMSSPKLLILDEPSLGLAPLLVREIFDAVKGLNDKGLSVLLVEQNATIAIAFSDRAYQLELGSVTPTDASAAQRSLMHAETGLDAGEVERAPLRLPDYQWMARGSRAVRAEVAQ
ncbi:ABC transporter ATP-binding protein [Salinibacterium sp. ZJ77]|uniref:ABC transporter ATP-binding protein n=1 Tax=Salinibacterium sp. ZJ77 TaxID=2708337 RepID=UPI001FBB4600|nr:ABC transporter ATP-binding protein [Salinibacterium sp. ZJ77]